MAFLRVAAASAVVLVLGVAASLGMTGAARADECPDDFVAFADTVDAHSCTCSAQAASAGSVWGMGPYTGDSKLCRAAVHAGAISKNGGDVTVAPKPGQKAYAGLTRNGVASNNYGEFASSFIFVGSGGAVADPAPAATQADNATAGGGACPDNFVAFADTTEPLACICAAEAASSGSVWGMDVYTGDSAVCRAAVHAGAIRKAGGAVTVVPEPGRGAYPGLTRNGVTSNNYGAFASSFRFDGVAKAAAGGSSSAGASSTPAPVTDCPNDFVAFADTAEPLACVCSPEAAGSGSVWGMDVYTGDSKVCRAAVHAGAIRKAGGQVTVAPLPGRSAYPGLTRNGVVSNNYGVYASSFRFDGVAAKAGAGAGDQAVTECPDNFVAFADTDEPLPCLCSAEASSTGSVWGMDVYTGDSRICRSAVHAGAVKKAGGLVTVLPMPGRKAYAGLTRNGVTSNNYGEFASSYSFAAAAAAAAKPAAATAGPVQKPIAETLKATGEVQLYVRFRTNSAELDPATVSVLEELLATLDKDSELKLALVGHTDAVGSREHNQGLSFRRADAVRTWLVSNGIGSSRLSVDGRGFDQPIADNGTESGRATNRRVQATRTN